MNIMLCNLLIFTLAMGLTHHKFLTHLLLGIRPKSRNMIKMYFTL